MTISPRRKRFVGRDILCNLASAAERQRLALPADSPRRTPTLPTLKFMRDEADDKQRADDAADRSAR